MAVEVVIVEVVGRSRCSADTVGVVLADGEWRRVSIAHFAHRPGARLVLEVVAPGMRPQDHLDLDDVHITHKRVQA